MVGSNDRAYEDWVEKDRQPLSCVAFRPCKDISHLPISSILCESVKGQDITETQRGDVKMQRGS